MPIVTTGPIKIAKEFWYIDQDGSLRHYMRLCNTSNTDHKVKLTDWGYGKNGKKVGNRTVKKMNIKAGKCKVYTATVTLKPGEGIPDQNYTDAWYEGADGSWKASSVGYGKIDIIDIGYASSSERGNVVVAVATAYPYRLESYGRPFSMYVKGVDGLPKKWAIANVYPPLNKHFTVTPDQKEISVLLDLSVPAPLKEGEVETLTLELAFDDAPEEGFEGMQHDIHFACDSTPPRIIKRKIKRSKQRTEVAIRVVVEDKVSTLQTPEIIFSRDGGVSWRRYTMGLKKALKINTRGISRGLYESIITLTGWDADLLVGINARDRFNNTASTGIFSIDDSLHKEDCV